MTPPTDKTDTRRAGKVSNIFRNVRFRVPELPGPALQRALPSYESRMSKLYFT
jgi:hypothetical protein